MHKRLEQYVETLDRQLTGLPTAERQEVLAEARAHLWALTEANQAKGQDAESAAEQAVARFGEAPTLGKDIRRESVSRRLRQGVTGKAAPVIGAALGMIVLATLALLLQMPLLIEGRDMTGVYLLLGALLGGAIALRRPRASWAFGGAFVGLLLSPFVLRGAETLFGLAKPLTECIAMSGCPEPWQTLIRLLIGPRIAAQDALSLSVFATGLIQGTLLWGRRCDRRLFLGTALGCAAASALVDLSWVRGAYWIDGQMRWQVCLWTTLFWVRYALLLGLILQGTRTIAQRLVDTFARLPQRLRPARIR